MARKFPAFSSFTLLCFFSSAVISLTDSVELSYRQPVCSHAYQELFQLPFNKFRLQSASNVGENEKFFGDFSITSTGKVRCSSSASKQHYSLHVFDLTSLQSFDVCLDIFGADSTVFENPNYEVSIDKCRIGKPIDGLDEIKLIIHKNSSIIDYKLVPTEVPFHVKLEKIGQFSIIPHTECLQGTSYSFYLEVSVATNQPDEQTATTDIQINVGKSSPVLKRQRRSSGNQDLVLLEESVEEDQTFANFDVLSALASESGNPRVSSFSWVDILYDGVIEVAEINSNQLVIRRKTGQTIDREVQNSHVLEFNVRDESTKELYKVRFVLEIVDVDDSAPEIINERMPLVGFAPLDTQPRAQILQLTIRDPDAKPEEPSDRQWTVEIEPENFFLELSEETIQPLSETETVWIRTRPDIPDTLAEKVYDFSVKLTDQAGNSRKYDVKVYVGEPFLIVYPIPDIIYVDEDLPSRSPVYRVKVETGTGSSVRFDFSVEPDDNAFTFTPYYGEIFTNRLFDRDTSSDAELTFAVTLVVSDDVTEITEEFQIQVRDVNDNQPIFTPSAYSTTIDENYPEDEPIKFNGDEITAVLAEDADRTFPNNEVYYIIDSNVPFIVNPVTGEVFTNGIDYEVTPNGRIDTFTIVARDKAGEDHREARAEVNVQINNVNDEAPVFDRQSANGSVCIYEFTVPRQDVEAGYQVGQVNAYDPDGNEVFFERLGLTTVPFELQNENSGIILRASTKDELLSQEEYTFGVKAFEIVEASAGATNEKSCQVIVNVESDNANAPEFKNCPNGEASMNVDEGSTVGTVIGTLSATDEDFGPHGAITFELHSTEWFSIERSPSSSESTIGTLKVNSTNLDREDRAERCVFVFARDGYTENTLDPVYRQTACKVCVTINDIADTPPAFFTTGDLQVTVLASNLEDEPFATIRASDADSVENEITYSIADGTSSELFGIDETTGELFNTESLAGHQTSSIYLEIVATDQSGDSATLSVTVSIDSSGGQVLVNPVFSNANDGTNAYKFSVFENSKLGLIGTELVVKRNDADVICVWSLQNGDAPATNKNNQFFHLNADPAQLKLVNSLNYEAITEFKFFVRCRDSEHEYLTTDAQIVINVVDVNDGFPTFVDSDRIFTVYEKSEPGVTVGTLKANDEDEKTVFDYSIEANANYDQNYFEVNAETGEVTVKTSPTTKGNWQGVAKVTDTAESAINPPGPNEGTMSLTIRVLDLNDNAPKIQPINSSPPYRVGEAENVGTVIAGFEAIDIDTDPEQSFTFSITKESGRVPFMINNQGILTVSQPLDADAADSVSKYTFNIEVFDNVNFSEPYEVIVIVENSDDEPPEITSRSFFSVKEEDSSLVDLVVFTVTAVNTDSVNGMDEIRYAISGSGAEDVFSINPATGEITLLREIDRETPGEDEFVLLVSATEKASDLTSVEQLFVTVEDENDHQPEFRENRRTFVTENAPKGEQFDEVTAFDDDLDDAPSNFGTIEYRKLDNEGTCGNLFSVTQNGGIVVEISNLDRETEPELNPNDECTLGVEAVDGGGKSGSTLITIVVQDVDDIPPVFVDEEVTAVIDEQPETERLVYGVYVEDGDTPKINGEANEVTLIENNNDFPDYYLFRVSYNPERSMVELRNLDSLTFVELGDGKTELRIRISIKATIDTQEFVDTIDCIFTLVDWNNHAPNIELVTPDPTNLPMEMREGPGFDLGPIATVSATDKDADEGGNNRGYNWYIDWSSDPHGLFKVESDSNAANTAHIYQVKALDHEIPQERQMTLKVCTEDLPDELYKPRLTSCFDLGIETINRDDECPILDPFPLWTVPENENARLNIAEGIQAIDFDDEDGSKTNSISIRAVSIEDSIFSFDTSNLRLQKNAEVALDRETREFHEVVLELCDQVGNCCEQSISIRVTDENDNDQSGGGSSTVIVYNTEKKLSRQVELGNSIFVQDTDCCNDDDKSYTMTSGRTNFFQIETDGLFRLLGNVSLGTFTVEVDVTENNKVLTSTVNIEVNLVTQKMIDHMITLKLMDIRADSFVGQNSHNGRVNYYARLKNVLSRLLKLDNADQVIIFAMRESGDNYEIDYDRPYHLPELDIGLVVRENFETNSDETDYMSTVYLNAMLSSNRADLSVDLGIDIAEININECESEASVDDCYTIRGVKSVHDESGDVITTGSSPRFSLVLPTLVIQTKLSNFYADNNIQRLFDLESNVCLDHPCKHGGECFPEYRDFSTLVMRYTFRCECVPGFTGPRCEKEDRTFRGTDEQPSYAVLEPLVFYRTGQHLSFDFMTDKPDGLLLYDGPMDEPYKPLRVDDLNENEDFIAVELINGRVSLKVNAGCETLTLENGQNLNDGEQHHVDIFIDQHRTVLRLDYCVNATVDETEFKSHVIREDVCEVTGIIPGCGNEISTPAPLQIGGLIGDPTNYKAMGVTQTSFDGVISNVENNGYLYDLYAPVISDASVSGNLKTQSFCFEGENAVCRGNAKCVATMTEFLYCNCEVGTFGDRCQFSQQPYYFGGNSFMLFDLEAQSSDGRVRRTTVLPDGFSDSSSMDLQISFRTTREDSTLFEVRNHLEYDHFQLRLVGGIPSAKFSLGSYLIDDFELDDAENAVEAGVWAADGNLHTLRLFKFNNFITLSIDGGGALKQKSIQDSVFNLFTIDPKKVSVGGWPVYEQQTGLYTITSGFIGCVSDLRINGITLPVKDLGSHESDSSVSVSISQSVETGCDKDPCAVRSANGDDCLPPRTRCLNWFDISLCTCILGARYDLTTEDCVNVNECDLGVCLNGATCTDVDPLTNDGKMYQCSCVDGYRGVTCAATAAALSQSSLSIAAAIIILMAIVILLLLLFLFIFSICQRRRRRPDEKAIIGDMYDDQRLGSGIYEGGGERDQEFYNIYPLRKPIEHVILTADGPQYVVDEEQPIAQFDYLQNPTYQQPNGNVNHGYVPDADEQPPLYLGARDKPIEEILGQRVEVANDAAHGRGADCLMVYHYEGEGSDVGTLSTVNTSPSQPPDFSQFNNWQYDPRFARVSEMFDEGESDWE